MTIYLPEYQRLQQQLYFGNGTTKKLAEQLLIRFHDHVVTTSLHTASTLHLRQAAYNHECSVTNRDERGAPEVVDDQVLRHLRHRLGFEFEGGEFASCLHCEKTWTYKELLRAFMRTDPRMTKNYAESVVVDQSSDGIKEAPVSAKPRLLANILQFQMQRGCLVCDTPTTCINANYQHHVSCHVKGCFKCQKNASSKRVVVR